MNMSDWEDNLLDYIFGAMPADDAALFERNLMACQERVALAQSYKQVIGVLGAAVPPAEPPEGHKARFMALIAATPQERPAPAEPTSAAEDAQQPMPRRQGLTVVSGARSASNDGPDTIHVAARTPQAAPITSIGMARSGRAMERWAYAAAGLAAMLAIFFGLLALTRGNDINIPPGYRLQAIVPQEEYTASAVALFNPNTQDTTIYASGLETLPEGKVYELWLLQPEGAGNPVPAGVFRGDPAGNATHKHVAGQPIRQYTGFAVTIEDAPGKPAPEGPIIMAGQYR